MRKKDYKEMLFLFNDFFEKNMIITWPNGLKVKCNAFHGMAEDIAEPGDEDYIGGFYTLVNNVKILEKGSDDSILIENDMIEISLIYLPNRIELEDGTLLWERS